MIPTRRSLLVCGSSAMLVPVTSALLRPTVSLADDARPAMRALAAPHGLIVGSAMAADQLNPDDRGLFSQELASITPENALKMDAIRPSRDAWHFTVADALVDFATSAGLAVRGHALIWNNDRQPDWINKLSAPELKAMMQEHIEKTMGRYGDRISVWDVINEPIGDVVTGPYVLRDGPFLRRLGPDYIAMSFRMARATAPNAKLVLNETHTERDDQFGLGYRKNLLFLIDKLQDAGVPLDGVGLQGHINSSVPFNLDRFSEFLAEIERRKLFIEITELDVNDATFPADEQVRDVAVAAQYSLYLDHVLANRAVRSLTFWQLGDRESWYYYQSIIGDPASLRRPRPLLFDLRMRPKPALLAVLESLKAMPDRLLPG